VTAADLSGLEDPPRVVWTDVAPVLSADGFDEPVDWLLEIVWASKIDLAGLPIAPLIEALATAMRAALAEPDGTRLDHWAAWAVTASALTELCSRLRLPDNAVAKAAETQAETLRRQLINRAQMRSAADWLERRQLAREMFARGRPDGDRRGGGRDVVDLMRACLVVLRHGIPHPPRPALWTVDEAIAHIRHGLREAAEAAALTSAQPQGRDGPSSPSATPALIDPQA